MATIPTLAAQTGPASLAALSGQGLPRIRSGVSTGLPQTMRPDEAAALAASGDKPVADPKAKARAQATDFEAVFLNTMFGQMFTAMDGEGPFGGAGGVWRSFLSDEYAKTFAKAGGIGLADHVYRALLDQQEARAN
jgi:Rod binding domain-containing protein